MASKYSRKTYRSTNPVKIILLTLLIVVVALIILAASVFFGFQKYLVYTPNGVELVLPWMEEYSPSAADNAADSALPLEEEDVSEGENVVADPAASAAPSPTQPAASPANASPSPSAAATPSASAAPSAEPSQTP